MRQQQFNMQGSDVDPIRSKHDLNTTRQSIKALLANGTPDWVRFPNDYKQFVKESFAEEKELSDMQVAGYRMEDQELLTNTVARKVNPIGTRDFILKLRMNGIKCFTIDNGFPRGTVALWAFKPFENQATYVCYLQVPAMYEWSVLRLDHHGLPNGEDFRGWRTALAQMIVKKIVTERRIHDVFGRPTDSVTGRRYRETLFNFRTGNYHNAEDSGL